ncbi:MAG TPA: cupredoxin domain-containing protein [Patescibacteria group bacterium]|nr:cupredoxin domain-containing protein [Patescibacteria group bacterium]
MNNKVVIGIILLVIILGGGYFAAKAIKHSLAPQPVQQPVAQPTTPQQASPATTSASPTTMQEISVSASEFAFTPSSITVKAGQTVKITFKNNGQYPHNFTISELSVQTSTIQPGQQTDVTFTPTKTGSFTFICSVPGHADRGMKGTLTVE